MRRPRHPAAAARARAGLWCERHVQLAAGVGVGLGLLGQVLIATLSRGGRDGSWWQVGAGMLLSTLGLMCVGLTLAVVSQRWVAGRAGRWLAVAVNAAVLSLLAVLLCIGVGLRVLSGSYLTVGALRFSFHSGDHFLHMFTGDYLVYLLAVVALAVSFGIAFGRVLLRAAHPVEAPGWPAPRYVVAAGALAAAMGLIYRGHEAHAFTRGMFVSTPMLALVSSLENHFEPDHARGAAGAPSEPQAQPGPHLSEGEAWRARLAPARRPNVLLLTLESVSTRHLGYLGYGRDTTPNLDRLAAESLDMRRAWTTATHSNYAQMAILSSLFPRRGTGLDQYQRLDYPRLLPHDVFHLLGYDTATISSQDEDWQGMRRFQTTPTPTFYWFSDDFTGTHIDIGTEEVVPDDKTTDEVIRWLDRERDQPWQLYVNFQATHFPYSTPPDAPRPFEPSLPTWSTFHYLSYPRDELPTVINRYDNALRYVDAQIGRLRDHLERTGQLDDTVWVITSDHGELFDDKDIVTHGRTLYDLEARVPLLVHYPRHVRPEVRHDPVSHLDIMPTVLELLGAPAHPAYQGRSFLTADTAPERRAIYLNIQGLRFADGLVCWPYKLVHERTSRQSYLFDLVRDPEETVNLLEVRPEITALLADTLRAQLARQLDYHAEESTEREAHYAPRLRSCPALPSASTPP